MKESILSRKQRKRWMIMYAAAINGNPPWKEDFEEWSKEYNKLMREKLELLEKYRLEVLKV